jgi:hypothetical protein
VMRILALTLILGASSTPARAGEHDRTAVLIADGVGDALALSVLVPHMPDRAISVMLSGGLIGQALAAPIIHAASADWGRAGIDLGARIAGPTLGVLVGAFVCDKVTPRKEGELLRCFEGALLGGAVGIVGAQIFDWLVLSRPTDDPASARMVRIGVRF